MSSRPSSRRNNPLDFLEKPRPEESDSETDQPCGQRMVWSSDEGDGPSTSTSTAQKRASSGKDERKKKKKKLSRSQPDDDTEVIVRVDTDDEDVEMSASKDKKGSGKDDDQSSIKGTETTENKVVDLSLGSPIDKSIKRNDFHFHLGSEFFLQTGTQTFKSGGTYGSFDAFTIGKTLDTDTGKPRELSINMPIRLVPVMAEAVRQLRKKMICTTEMPATSTIVEWAKNKQSVNLEPFIKRREVPHVAFKLDESFWLKGEQVSFGRSNGTYDVISLVRKNKGDDTSKPFTLTLPVRIFDNLEVAIKAVMKLIKF